VTARLVVATLSVLVFVAVGAGWVLVR